MGMTKGACVVLLVFFANASWLYPENAAIYVGSKKCSACHSAIDATWQKTRHGKAIESLKKTGQETLPACVKCHVTGYEKDGGFIDYELTPEMAGVQCEVCHGPGSNHMSTLAAKDIIRKAGAELCRQCHTQGQDPGFSYELKVKDVHGK